MAVSKQFGGFFEDVDLDGRYMAASKGYWGILETERGLGLIERALGSAMAQTPHKGIV